MNTEEKNGDAASGPRNGLSDVSLIDKLCADPNVNEAFKKALCRDSDDSTPIYTKAEAEALCAIAVAAVKKSFDLCSDCPPLYWKTDKTRCKSCPRTAVKRRPKGHAVGG